ncbi:MAG: PD40 domain-containing protein [Planctomycetes bacterium]|nr:PD40 domain-containing protein [Planctomycetota bacterium]
MLLAACLAFIPLLSTQEGAPVVHVLATVPDGCEVKPDTLRFSANGTTVAYVAVRGKKQHAVTGNRLGDDFEEVLAPVIDRLGEHVAFRGIDYPKRDEPRYTLLFDGKKLASDAWIGPVALAPLDSTPAFWQAGSWRHEALAVRVPTGCTLNFGKKRVSKWEKADSLQSPVFSDDGRFLYSVGSRQEDWDIVVYDLKGKDSVMTGYFVVEVRVRPDGGELVVTKQTSASFNRRAYQTAKLVVARIPTNIKRGYEGVVTLGEGYRTTGGPIYSSDGKHVAYRACRNKKFGVAVDATTADCVHGYVDEFVFAPTSKRVAYSAIDDYLVELDNGAQALDGVVKIADGGWFVVWGEQKSAEFERTKLLRWSPDGSRVAFAGKRGGEWRVHVGEKSSDPFDEIADVAWSLDGKLVWCGARRGRELVWAPLVIE